MHRAVEEATATGTGKETGEKECMIGVSVQCVEQEGKVTSGEPTAAYAKHS